MGKRYFLTDLDGTLLQSDATVSEYTRRLLASAQELGVVIGYATARGLISSRKVTEGVDWKHPRVLYNGALIVSPDGETVLGGNWLNPEMTERVLACGREHGLVPLLFVIDGDNRELVYHEKLHRTGDIQFCGSRPGDPRFREQVRLNCPGDCRTLSITYIGLAEELEPLHQKVAVCFGDQVHTHMMKDNYIKDHYFLEISHARANKREGALLWAELAGCKPEELTVFGDNLNDLGLFEAAGCRVAVANAHPDLLKLAHRTTASNDEDGVARYIESEMLRGSDGTNLTRL
jgi:5-amino-6-(5-phospho-D-ribitylamino)uracil phosphatase